MSGATNPPLAQADHSTEQVATGLPIRLYEKTSCVIERENSDMKPSRLACMAAVLLALPIAARAESIMVAMPPGWTVTTLAAPSLDGSTVAGSRRRAILPGPAGQPAAAIELIELPQDADLTAKLAATMQDALDQAASDFAEHKLENRCRRPEPARVAGQPALRADCTLWRGDQPLLRQAIVMFLTQRGLYSLSYSAAATGYDAYQVDFDRVLGSVRLE